MTIQEAMKWLSPKTRMYFHMCPNLASIDVPSCTVPGERVNILEDGHPQEEAKFIRDAIARKKQYGY